MKPSTLLATLMLVFFLGSSPSEYTSDSEYFPVLMKNEDLEKSIKFLEAREIESPGKIYYKDQIIYLNEKYKGVHIIDNHDPLNPRRTGFINIPGCLDIAINVILVS